MKVPVHNDFIWHNAGSFLLKVHANIVLIVRIISRNNEHLFQIGELSLEKKIPESVGCWGISNERRWKCDESDTCVSAVHLFSDSTQPYWHILSYKKFIFTHRQ